jgi:hypothetical protein
MKKRFGCGLSLWRCWVVEDGKQLLGHVCVQLFEKMPNPVKRTGGSCLPDQFLCGPGNARPGLGRKLLKKALSWCRARGADAVILWATPDSKSLYRRCGLLESDDILELRGNNFRPRI